MTLRRLIRDTRGQTLVESALSIAIVLAVLVFALELTVALYDFNYVSYAARAGTRWAMVRGSACHSLAECDATAAQIQTYVRGLGFPLIQPSSLAVTTTWLSKSTTAPATWTACGSSPCNAPGNAVQLIVTYPFTIRVPLFGALRLSLHSTSRMVIAQ